jgi:hypothetical protein
MNRLEQARIARAWGEMEPRDLGEWVETNIYANAGEYLHPEQGLKVLAEVAQYRGDLWLHVSVSSGWKVTSTSSTLHHPNDSLPTWEQLCAVKDVFIGRDREAIQKFPRAAEYVNDRQVLHLWHLIGRDLTPDFRKHSPELGRASI